MSRSNLKVTYFFATDKGSFIMSSWLFRGYGELNACSDEKRSEFWQNQSWSIYHYNAPVHTFLLVSTFFSQKQDVAHAEFSYFQNCNSGLTQSMASYYIAPRTVKVKIIALLVEDTMFIKKPKCSHPYICLTSPLRFVF